MRFMPKQSKKRSRAADDAVNSRNGLREAILGLLAIRPMSGYDVSRSYQRALQQIWYAPLGQVYPTLRSMAAAGLLRFSVQVQQDRPNRKVYSLTQSGRRMFVAWLSQPATLPNMHHEFIHKLFLLNHVEAPRRIPLIETYIAKCSAWAEELRGIERKLETALDGPHGESAWYQLLSLRHLCRIVECEAQSARDILSELRLKLGTGKKAPKVVRGQRSVRAAGPRFAFAGLSLSPADRTADFSAADKDGPAR
jgi:PadR family transcriptional regulator, regulatory protein AphA